MEIVQTCNCCKGKGKITRQLEAGDIISPTEGSGLPNGLKPILQIWQNQKVVGFKPVKILYIEGQVLFVTPISWQGKEWDKDVHAAQSWMLIDGNGVIGFWVYAPHCYFSITKAEGKGI